MNKNKRRTIKLSRITLFCCLALSVSAHAHISSRHVIGETVAQFAAKIDVDMDTCHRPNAHTWTCKALISAEQGNRVEIQKQGKWMAVLDGGKLVSYEDIKK